MIKPGTVDPVIGLMFVLPPGYRPAAGKSVAFEPANGQSVFVGGNGAKIETTEHSGAVLVPNPAGTGISLSGIQFLAQG